MSPRVTVKRWTHDNAKRHVTAFRPISEAAHSWSCDNQEWQCPGCVICVRLCPIHTTRHTRQNRPVCVVSGAAVWTGQLLLICACDSRRVKRCIIILIMMIIDLIFVIPRYHMLPRVKIIINFCTFLVLHSVIFFHSMGIEYRGQKMIIIIVVFRLHIFCRRQSWVVGN